MVYATGHLIMGPSEIGMTSLQKKTCFYPIPYANTYISGDKRSCEGSTVLLYMHMQQPHMHTHSHGHTHTHTHTHTTHQMLLRMKKSCMKTQPKGRMPPMREEGMG